MLNMNLATLSLVLIAGAAGLPAQDAPLASLRVCTRPAPGFFTSDGSGPASGLEFDLLSGFAAATGRRLAFEPAATFDQLLKDTESGRCGIGAATVTVSEERKARVRFTLPYFPNRVVVVQKTSTAFANAADLKDRRVAAVKGTISERLVQDLKGALPRIVAEDAVGFESLLKGEVDAFACDSAVVLHHLGLHPDLALAFPIGERSFFAFALPKDSNLVAPLDEYLRRVIRSGEFRKMLAKHFGADNAETLAQDVVAALPK